MVVAGVEGVGALVGVDLIVIFDFGGLVVDILPLVPGAAVVVGVACEASVGPVGFALEGAVFDAAQSVPVDVALAATFAGFVVGGGGIEFAADGD